MKKTEKIIAQSGEGSVTDYRPLPFWSWNDELDEKELIDQIEWMSKQGFGGFFMHARGGLKTEYLGDKWFDCVEACLNAGKARGMKCWVYDENGWPSGFVGGKLLENPENRDGYLTYAFGAYDRTAFVSYRMTEASLVRIRTEEEAVAGEYLNVYVHVSESTADMLDPRVVEAFLTETHERYRSRFGAREGDLKGFFTDEPQYYGIAHPYTKKLDGYFSEVYGDDLLDGLGLMFVEKNGYRSFRYRYWKGMQTLLLENFARKVYMWCEKNGMKLTGHYVEESTLGGQMRFCGGIMPFYIYESIPGIDHLSARTPSTVSCKQVSSVARQLGKKQVLSECFAGCGWGVTPWRMKEIAEAQLVNGINLLCLHLLPYSERGQRKRDYPAHYSWVNPWVKKNFKDFNDYFARLGYLLGESEELVNTALFCPIRSEYLEYKQENYTEAGDETDISYRAWAEKLSSRNLPYHILDETVLEKLGSAKDGVLSVGHCVYRYVIFPRVLTMGKESERLFGEFYRSGGKMLFAEGVPEYLEGERHAYSFSSNVSLDEIAAAQEVRTEETDTFVRSTLRERNGQKFLYVVNINSQKAAEVTFRGAFNGFERVDMQTLKTRTIGRRVRLEAGESCVLIPSDGCGEELPSETVVLDGEFEVTDASDNYLLLDALEYSTDGVHYGERLRYMGIFNELLKRRFQGEVYLRYAFEIRELPERIYFLAEDMNTLSCKVNGHEICFTEESDFEKRIRRADIAPFVQVGYNEAVLKINFRQSEKVYYALFGEGVTEGVKNCLSYDTTIEACYLQGDFGVYAPEGFHKEQGNIRVAKDFYVGTRRHIVRDTVKDGYPFFAGWMTLKKKFSASGGRCALKLSGEFCLAEIFINGKRVKTSYFCKTVDISDSVREGENIAEITLWSGNRNLLGPHHLKGDRNPVWVGVDTYEQTGTWTDGRSSRECDEYSFVRFGLFSESEE